jgi:hypothetical protein
VVGALSVADLVTLVALSVTDLVVLVALSVADLAVLLALSAVFLALWKMLCVALEAAVAGAVAFTLAPTDAPAVAVSAKVCCAPNTDIKPTARVERATLRFVRFILKYFLLLSRICTNRMYQLISTTA